jgi:hypothetical protein
MTLRGHPEMSSIMEYPAPMTGRDDGFVPSPSGWIRDLEELRRKVLARLQLIEDQALRRPAGRGESARMEEGFHRKLEDLERERARLLQDADRKETSWKERLTQIEDDRKLLADAWQRIERERIDAAGMGGPARRPVEASPPRPAAEPGRSDVTDPARAAGTVNPVAESILRQFQTLCQDVRRASDMRGSPR